MLETISNRPAGLADYLAILRRRAWIVAIPLVLAPVGAFFASKAEQPLYQASGSVFINRTPATAAATGVYDQSATTDPVRFFQTQADLAREPALLDSVGRTARRYGVSRAGLAGSSSVAPSPTADLLIFSVSSTNPGTAVALTNAYAKAFTRFQPEQDTSALTTALKTVKAKVADLKAGGVPSTSAVYGDLLTKESQLETALVLQAGNRPHVVQPAAGAAQIRPRTHRNTLLGLALGGILGIGLAFLREALDKRVRTEREIEEVLGLPLLGRLPTPPRRLRKAHELAMVREPRSAPAEAVRGLRTNLEFATLEHPQRSIMITSALEQEGKSTTIANLAVALARSGRRVALVDFDLRRPYLHRFFPVSSRPGLTEVLAGHLEVGDAVRAIAIPEIESSPAARTRATPGNGSGKVKTLFGLLPAGALPPDPGELMSSPRLREVIEQLKSDWDVVLVDAPPMSAVGDALALSASVDAVVVVTRLGAVNHGVLRDLARLLDTSPANVLGFVVTGAEQGEVYSYDYGYGYRHTPEGTETLRGEERVR